MLLYKSGIVYHFPQNSVHFSENPFLNPTQVNGHFFRNKSAENFSESSYFRFKHSPKTFRNHLFFSQHWATLFGYYNISLSGRYISFLPPIHLSIPVEPSEAIKARHPSESDIQKLYSASSFSNILASFDSNDDLDELSEGSTLEYTQSRTQFTFREIMIFFICSISTIFCMFYILATLYRCMCSRRYDEWRSSWSNNGILSSKSNDSKNKQDMFTLEAMIRRLAAHENDIEMIASTSESPFVVSCCMQGDVRIWDVLSGECHTHIKRCNFEFESKCEKSRFRPHHKPSGSFSSDSTYGSLPSNGSSEFKFEADTVTPETTSSGYNFGTYYSRLNASRSIISELVLSAANNDPETALSMIEANREIKSTLPYQQIWCLNVFKKYILIGCSKGRFEVWDAITGTNYSNEKWNSGITMIKADNYKLAVGHIDGVLELYQFDDNLNSKPSEFHNSTYYEENHEPSHQTLHFHLLNFIRAHSQPITALQLNNNHLITGSSDRLLKVYKIETGACVYTLHGHFGGISCLEIDSVSGIQKATCPFNGLHLIYLIS